MTIDGFLTFLGFLVAAYAVLNPVTRLRIGLHSTRQVALLIIIFPAVLSLLFFEQVMAILPPSQARNLEWLDKTTYPSTPGPEKLAFILVIIWVACSFALYKLTRPNSFAICKLRVLLERLHDEKRFLELIEISGPYIGIIDLAIKRELFLQKQHYLLRRKSHADDLAGLINMLELRSADAPPPKKMSLRSKLSDAGKGFVNGSLGWLSYLFPPRASATNDARSIETLLLKSSGVSDILTFVRPDVSLKLSSMETTAAEEFRTNLFRRMLNDVESRFYAEIELLQVTSGHGNYVNIREAPFLGPIVTDSKLACRLNVSKSIGDEAIRLISSDKSYRDRLNGPCPDEESVWKDPVFCILQLFSMMISNAARQGIRDNMWLMYMSDIARGLEEAYGPTSPSIDTTLEFPTLGCRLLYEISSNHQDWLRLALQLPADNFHISTAEFDRRVSASIPWSSAGDYAETIRIIVGSSRLPDRFRKDRWESYVRSVCSFPTSGALAPLRQRLIAEAIEPSGSSSVSDVKDEIAYLQSKIDQVVRFSCPEMDEALERAS